MAKLERTSVPGVYRAHKKTCENRERCDCPYKVIWRHRGRQYSETCRSFAEAREQKALRATVDSRPASRSRFGDYFPKWIETYAGLVGGAERGLSVRATCPASVLVGQIALRALVFEQRPADQRAGGGVGVSTGAATLTDQQCLLPVSEHDSHVVAEGFRLWLEVGVIEAEVTQVLVPLDFGHGVGEQRPDLAAGDAGPHFDAIRARLLLDLGTPGIRVLDLLERQEHLSRGEQRPLVVAPPHPGDEALDPSVDLDRIRHRPMLRLSAPYARTSTSQRMPFAFFIAPSAVTSKASRASAKAT